MTMREILFRGKHVAGSPWCYGNLAVRRDGVYIITPDATPCGVYGQVDPDTIGQYTGLTDKYGKKIFEGDIVKAFNTFHDREEQYVIRHTGVGLLFCENANEWHPEYIEQAEVVGNIHDNPDMMGGE